MLKRTMVLAVCAAPLGLLAPAPAAATTLDGIEGVVMVNRGKGFEPVRGTLDLKAGEKIMAKPGGSALLVYGHSCVVPVRAGAVVAVEKDSPCPGTNSAKWKVEINTQVSETGSATPPAEADGTVPSDEGQLPPSDADNAGASGPGWSTEQVILGGVALGGGVAAAAVLASKKSSGSPASP